VLLVAFVRAALGPALWPVYCPCLPPVLLRIPLLAVRYRFVSLLAVPMSRGSGYLYRGSPLRAAALVASLRSFRASHWMPDGQNDSGAPGAAALTPLPFQREWIAPAAPAEGLTQEE
jgi:hypothetical protein